jgi:UDPglucose--hexose-1-phosphate uridylyltransferase
VPNKFPAISPDPLSNEKTHGLFRAMSGGGRHEVIIDSPDHKKGLADLPEIHTAEVLSMLQRRVRAMYETASIRSVAPFKNHGQVAGASLEHSHLQVIGIPVVPPNTETARNIAGAFYRETSKPLLEKIIEWELGQGKRIVEDGKNGVIAYCPFASRFPFQTEISPWPAQKSFSKSPPEVTAAVGGAFARALQRIKILLGDPPLNVFFHIETRPEPGEDEAAHQWRIEIVPRLTNMAGLEIGAGMHINEVAPEEAAKKLGETQT